MTSDPTLQIIGAVLLMLGLVCALWGDKQMPESGSRSSRFSPLSKCFKRHRWLKWAMGGGLIYAGIEMLVLQ